MEALQDVADDELGSIVSFDMIFDAVENDLLSQEYLGASGVRSIRESYERVPGIPVDPARILKVLWLLQKVSWVPRVPETLAKLLVRDLKTEIPPLREKVEQTLDKLQEAGYVARDEATGEWKFLNEKERTIEQTIQEMVRPGGPKSISVSAVRRTSQEMTKADLVTKRKLANFTVAYGATKATVPLWRVSGRRSRRDRTRTRGSLYWPACSRAKAGNRRHPASEPGGWHEGAPHLVGCRHTRES